MDGPLSGLPGAAEPVRRAAELFDLADRVAMVTGASSGLGLRHARVLAAAGARLVVTARRGERLDALADEIGRDRCLPVPSDLTRPGSAAALVGAAVDRFGRLDVLVNNAGMGIITPAEEETDEAFGRTLALNLQAVFACCREAGRVMLGQGSGSIVNVASVAGFKVVGHSMPQASYTASKGAVIQLTRELDAQWARQGVRVNGIAPGWFRSEMSEGMFTERGLRWIELHVPVGRPGREGELDGVLLFLASDASSFVHGQVIAVDGGQTIV